MVDSPGYGFAEGSKKEIESWRSMMDRYLAQSRHLHRVLCLVDSRRGVDHQDLAVLPPHQLFQALEVKSKPFLLCFTKVDDLRDAEHANLVDWTLKDSPKFAFLSPFVHFTSAKYARLTCRTGFGLPELNWNLWQLMHSEVLDLNKLKQKAASGIKFPKH